MFEKFTERARKVMSMSRQEAQARNCEFISTEHMLISMLREGGGVGAQVLKRMGMTLDNVISEVDKMTPPSSKPAAQLSQLPFSPRVRCVIELAAEEAYRTNQEVVGTEHLLLGLFLETEGTAAQVLGKKFDVTEPRLRKELREILGDQAARIAPSLSTPNTSGIRISLFRQSEGNLETQYLSVNDVKYAHLRTITLDGVPIEKRESVAKAIAANMGCQVYTVEPIA